MVYILSVGFGEKYEALCVYVLQEKGRDKGKEGGGREGQREGEREEEERRGRDGRGGERRWVSWYVEREGTELCY